MGSIEVLGGGKGCGIENIPAIAPKGPYMCGFKKSSVREISILI
jgi:hypothetical protein